MSLKKIIFEELPGEKRLYVEYNYYQKQTLSRPVSDNEKEFCRFNYYVSFRGYLKTETSPLNFL